MKKKICLVAVDIRSTHNVGSLFRTCEGFGVDMFLVGISPRPLGDDDDNRLPYIAQKAHKAISKTALGAEETVKWRYADTLLECKTVLKREGYDLLALELDPRSKNLRKLKPKNKTAIVVGREVEGLDGVELKMCDEIYEIPMVGKKESFNVSVAAGVALYQATA